MTRPLSKEQATNEAFIVRESIAIIESCFDGEYVTSYNGLSNALNDLRGVASRLDAALAAPQEQEIARLTKERDDAVKWADLVTRGKGLCGHWKVYSVTEDGGKHITCLQCRAEHAEAALAAEAAQWPEVIDGYTRDEMHRAIENGDTKIAFNVLGVVSHYYARCTRDERLANRTNEVAAEAAPQEKEIEPWKGYWNNWIAPFHACPRCGKSLNWQRHEDALDRPLIRAECCGLFFGAQMEWEAQTGKEQAERAAHHGNAGS